MVGWTEPISMRGIWFQYIPWAFNSWAKKTKQKHPDKKHNCTEFRRSFVNPFVSFEFIEFLAEKGYIRKSPKLNELLKTYDRLALAKEITQNKPRAEGDKGW